jgi:hypothetical protein
MKTQSLLKAEAPSADLLLTAAAGQLLKARISGYTRKDGTFVAEHDDSRTTVKPKQPVQHTAKRKYSFIDILDDPEGRQMIRAYEDTVSSITHKGGTGADPILDAVLETQHAEIKKKFGFSMNKPETIYKPLVKSAIPLLFARTR